ncbi:glycerol-3-phosphate dehydrogenase/oxidase [Vagococcus salmoninarum]|uniref:Alpha-glycerophosphate oxidase n=1 Tax=Vagococcus salmoninarum TaxID=2739 RepID=A0A429ZUU8_9ENTE|nr:FAD-dependent oxidoreductase [Vagococcus salmoninarum]MBE9388050.1 FAD-dependent oxidoreductase [Vagococcus salmoninarum]RST97481.1 hypothetical protein CBF35_02095 [Vagococcus salmoninarum]
MNLSRETRQKHLRIMTETPLDLLVIGGGITGAGITIDGISRGLGVALIEMGDFASGATSASHKLLRGEISTNNGERKGLLENAPHLTKAIKVLTPIFKQQELSLLKSAVALKAYDFLSQTDKDLAFFTLNRSETLKREPLLKKENLKSSSIYTEYRTNDSRLTLEIIKKAVDFGAYVANYTKVVKFLYNHQTGKIIGVRAIDGLTGEEIAIYAKRVVNATGSWSGELSRLDKGTPLPNPSLKEQHYIVLSAKALPVTNALNFLSEITDQSYFVIPVGDKIYVGPHVTSLNQQTLAQQQLLDALNDFFTMPPIELKSIESSWTEPSVQDSPSDSYSLSRSGLISVTLTELYTYRLQSKLVVDRLLRSICKEYHRLFIKCRTKNLSVAGGDVGGSTGFHRYQKEFIRIGVEKFHLSHGHASLLVNRYGSNVIDLYAYLLNVPPHTNLADLDYVMLRYALEAEMCLHPLDFLKRRTDYFYFNKEQAIAIADHVIDEMAKYYQWSKIYHEQIITETWLALAN